MTAGDIPPLTSWDWFILTVAFISTGLGIWRGLIRTVFGLAAWILGLIGAPLLGMMIGERFGISGVPMWVLYVLAFLVTFIVVGVGYIDPANWRPFAPKGYTGISFFRQFPHGVPGAYRLFANLLALGAK